MSKISFSDLMTQVALVNTQRTSSNIIGDENESTSSKLSKYAKEIHKAQDSIESAYNAMLELRQHVCNLFAAGYSGKSYYLKAEIAFNKLKKYLDLLKSLGTSKDKIATLIDNTASVLNSMVMQHNNPSAILNSISELNKLCDTFETLAQSINTPNECTVSTDTGKAVITAKTPYPKYLNSEKSDSAKILFGKISDDSLIAQETPVIVYMYKSDPNAMYISMTNYKLMNVKFNLAEYKFPFPLSLIFSGRKRFESVPYEEENEDAEDEKDVMRQTRSVAYFDGSWFFGGGITYNGISSAAGEKHRYKFYKTITKRNSLTGSVSTAGEYTKIATDIELVYNDEDDINNASRPDDNISDSIDVMITMSGPRNIMTKGNLTRSAELCGEYYDDDTGMTINAVTGYSGSLTGTDGDTSTSIPVNTIIYKDNSNNKYKVLIKPDISSSVAGTLFQASNVVDAALMSSVSRTFYAYKSNVVNNLNPEDKLSAAFNALANMDNMLNINPENINSMIDSNALSNAMGLLNDMAEYIIDAFNEIVIKINNYVNEIIRILNSYITLDSMITMFANVWEPAYTGDMLTNFKQLYGELSQQSKFEPTDPTTHDEFINLLETGLNKIDTSIDEIIVDAITVFNKIEDVRGVLSPILNTKISIPDYEPMINEFTNALAGKNDTAIALASGGNVFVTINSTYNYKKFIEDVREFSDIDTYYGPILYLLKEYYTNIGSIKSTDPSLEYIYELYYEIITRLYKQHSFSNSVIDYSFRTKYEQILYDIDIYKLPLPVRDYNEFYICSDVIAVSEAFNEFNNIDIDEVVKTIIKSGSNYLDTCYKLCSQWKPIIYRVLNNYNIDTFPEIFNRIDNIYGYGTRIYLNMRDLLLIETLRQVEYELVDLANTEFDTTCSTDDPDFKLRNRLNLFRDYPVCGLYNSIVTDELYSNKSYNITDVSSTSNPYDVKYKTWLCKMALYINVYTFGSNILDGIHGGTNPNDRDYNVRNRYEIFGR